MTKIVHLEEIIEMKKHNLQKTLSDNNAVLEPFKLNDRHRLGAINVFAKTHFIQKRLDNNNIKWMNILPGIIERYNNTQHASIEDIIPN
jgi:hypothetical protein